MDKKVKQREIKNTKDFDNFIQWLRDNGAQFPSLKFKLYGENERGVHSKTELKKGRTLIHIPRNVLIHDGIAGQVKHGKQLIEATKNNRANKVPNYKITLVTVYILATIKQNGFYEPYYRILPTNLSNFPIFWEKQDLDYLKGSYMIKSIHMRKQQLLNEYNQLSKLCEGFIKSHTFDEFVKIRTIVGSRNFGITINGVKRIAMVPLADMLNHDQQPSVSWGFDNEKDGFVMQSRRNIQLGEAITDSYGIKCNSQYLMFYGFTLPNNHAGNFFTTDMVYGGDEQTKQIKMSLIQRFNRKITMNYATCNDFQSIMSFLRIAVSDLELLKQHTFLHNFNNPINLSNESDALNAFKTYIDTMLKGYGKSYQEIKGELASIKTLNNKYNAYQLILGEMEILKHYKAIVTYAINLIQRRPNPKTNTQCPDYFRNLQELVN